MPATAKAPRKRRPTVSEGRKSYAAIPGNGDDELLTLTEAAHRLNLTQPVIHNWINRGDLPTVPFGRNRRVRAVAIRAVLAGKCPFEAQRKHDEEQGV